ncbi:zinc-dependent alcohol dehydrogenase [Anaerotruncus rubiinfantis]|uniref:zinc-dependent alcohol dehydrogenase n=1 Tax=Anaerotruncus rubiinfantis TaxID=1720200 RepID=UPI00189A3B08|nr:alcohol dehydrogenase catalytic domain-containing protein [Anaerotruncus rubiinfantis]
MKAAVLTDWKHLEIKEIGLPVLQDGEALLKVIYAGICGSDITVYKGDHPTAKVPVVPCHEIIGTIEEIRCGTPTAFSIGQRVTVEPLISCGECEPCRNGCEHVCNSLQLLGIHQNGGFAQYVKVSVKKLVALPEGLPDRVAALAEPFAVAYHVNHRSGIRAGDAALVIGGGPIGITVAIAARHFGARRVIISEINEKRLALAESLGLETVNPMKTDLNQLKSEVTGGNGLDVVFESSGSKQGLLMLPDMCKTRGTMISLSLSGTPVEFAMGKVSFREMTIVGSRVYSFDHFCRAVPMLEKLAQEYPLENLATDVLPLNEVQKGYDMMLDGTNAGKVLISCNS